MDVSIIIVNYKTCGLVIDCVNSILEKTKVVSYEVIIVDNNSGDGSVETLMSLFPQIRVFPLKENIGFGKANNIGVHNAAGRFIFFLNSDIILLNDAISILVNYLDRNKHVDLCGGQLYDKDKKLTNSYFEYPDFKYFLSLILKGNVINEELPILSSGKTSYYISGADMMVRRSFIDKYGAFDPDFFMYYEDTELSLRVQKSGGEVHFVPEARIVHLQDMSPKERGTYISKLDLYVIQSRYLYLRKAKGVLLMNLLLFLHKMKSVIAICYFSLTKESQKVRNWKSVIDMLKSIN